MIKVRNVELLKEWRSTREGLNEKMGKISEQIPHQSGHKRGHSDDFSR